MAAELRLEDDARTLRHDFDISVETSVALAYPAHSSRFAVEARGMFSAVHHHTAGLDGGFSPPGPSGNWAGNLGIGVGAQVAF